VTSKNFRDIIVGLVEDNYVSEFEIEENIVDVPLYHNNSHRIKFHLMKTTKRGMCVCVYIVSFDKEHYLDAIVSDISTSLLNNINTDPKVNEIASKLEYIYFYYVAFANKSLHDMHSGCTLGERLLKYPYAKHITRNDASANYTNTYTIFDIPITIRHNPLFNEVGLITAHGVPVHNGIRHLYADEVYDVLTSIELERAYKLNQLL
jgi:hypothetical protein